MQRIDAVAERIAAASARIGREVRLDPWSAIDARGQARHRGPTSAGGACRMVRVADGWIAVSLPRASDFDLLPAWLGLAEIPADPWPAVNEAARSRPAQPLVDFGRELGLAVSRVGEATSAEAIRVTPRAGGGGELRVVDLSTMWAGPLCGAIIAAAGAQVTKFESTSRPDGARHGQVALFDALNAGKQRATADLRTAAGRAMLAALIDTADAVIESSRPRALQQLGIDRRRWGGRVWLSITGHGRDHPGIAFGDDAAAAGGLVEEIDDAPVFVGDALADPLTGLVAAAEVLEILADGRSAFVDVSMSGVAARMAGR